MSSIITKELEFKTNGVNDIIDITPRIQDEFRKTGLKNGILTIFVSGSTAAVSTVEYEPGLRKDLPEFYEKIIPIHKNYAHNNTWGDANGYAHIRATLQGPSLTVPFVKGEFTLGTWQQIVFMEFDNRPRKRRVILQFMGK